MGTASRVQAWFVLEQPGPWGSDALLESQLDPLVARVLLATGRRRATRVLLSRRPGWEDTGHRRAYIANSKPTKQWIEQLDLDDPRQLLSIRPPPDGDHPEPPGLGVPGPSVVHLVCTNGRHDKCCADFGRPVVRALVDAGTPEVWECSHVGGDRFAANIVCLPSGVYFGRVEPDEAPELLAEFDRGLLRLERYRGRSCYAPLVQCADVLARRELDERRVEGLRVVSAAASGEHDARVVVAQVGGSHLEVTVRREQGQAEHLTCGSQGSSRPWNYRLTGIRVAEAPPLGKE